METTIYSILGLFWENGKENGNYFLGFRVAATRCLEGQGGLSKLIKG